MLPHLILSLILILSSCSNPKTSLYGYVEADYLYLSPSSSGFLEKLYVEEGESVKKDSLLFALEATSLKADLEKARAQLQKAKANYSNLLKGKRKEELLVLEKKLEREESELSNSKIEFARAKTLVDEGAVSQSYFDNKESIYKSKLANFESTKAEIKVAELKSRSDEIEAARAEVLAQKQNLIRAEKQISESKANAPRNGFVQETFFQEGEYVKASQAVLSLLIPEEIKVVFYVPQERRSQIKLGDIIRLDCDGCAKNYKAKVSFISPEAEFSPPVIYSNESRDKLVYMIEARFVDDGLVLSSGLPVDIRLEI